MKINWTAVIVIIFGMILLWLGYKAADQYRTRARVTAEAQAKSEKEVKSKTLLIERRGQPLSTRVENIEFYIFLRRPERLEIHLWDGRIIIYPINIGQGSVTKIEEMD